MSLRSRLAHIEKVRAQADLDAFRRRWHWREGDPPVSAAFDAVVSRMGEVEAAISHPITRAEWLDNAWMAGHGMVEVLDHFIAAVNAGDGP